MVCPDADARKISDRASACCIELAGESPVRVGAGAPGSRPQARGEILGSERGVESLR